MDMPVVLGQSLLARFDGQHKSPCAPNPTPAETLVFEALDSTQE